MIDRAPQIVSLPTDLHEHLVKVTLPLRTLPHALQPALADLVREVSAETVAPVANRFMANIDTAIVKQVSDVPQRQRNRTHIITASRIIWRCLEVTQGAFRHQLRLNAPARASRTFALTIPTLSVFEQFPADARQICVADVEFFANEGFN